MKKSSILSIAAVATLAFAAEAKNLGVAWNASSSVTNCVDADGNPATNCPSISYNVFLYTNSADIAFTNKAVSVYPAAGTNLVMTNLAVGTVYWVNVNAQDANGLSSDLSETISFTFPGAPVLLHLVP